MTTASRSDSGFTLLEFVVAVVVLMVGLLGLLQTVGLTYEHNLGTQRREDAAQVADDLMMAEKVKKFEGISTTSKQWNLTESAFKSGYVNYSVSKTAALVAPDTINLSITLSWRHKGKRFEHSISSLRSRNE